MRLVLINPHVCAYGRTVSSFVFRKKMFKKYNFILENYIKDEKKDAAFYIDGSYNSFNLNWPILAKFFSYLELIFWMLLNNVNPFRIKIYFSIRKLDPKNDIIFTFSRTFINISEKRRNKLELDKFDGLIFIHFTHYFQKIKLLADFLKKIKFPVIVAENDLTSNDFFKKYFPGVERVYQLPNGFEDRFILKNEDFNRRENKCLALGTMCPANEKEYADFFNLERCLQPMRRIIFEKNAGYKNEIDSFIKEFKDVKSIKSIKAKDSLLIKILKRILPYVILSRLIHVPQEKYFQFDIVKKYNEYKMFVCPEEAIGLPSINVFEGMACQCAYIGINSPMYSKLGLIPGVHYVAYQENNFEDLISKIRYYQKNSEELRKIAEAGHSLARQNFNRQEISKKFWQDMETISRQFYFRKKVDLICSFNI